MTQRANDHLIQIIGAVAGIGILAVALMAYFQWRAVTRLAAIAEQLPERLALHSPRMHTALESGSPTHVSGGLLEAVDRIERRIRELEHTTPFAVSDVKSDKNEHENHQGGVQTSRVSLLIEKGQSHLDLNEADSAIACLDEALELEPANANALVKKGTALERLQRFDEALTCYNRAIAAEDSTTMAYLCKGAVLNRLQRYGEALECYEQALRTQQKAA